MQATINSLTERELSLVREADAQVLRDLDEDSLLELHERVRRARNRYQGQYRRRGAVQIAEIGGRGKSWQQNQRARDKAEVFEATLARVSTALGKAARHAAAELKAERLAAARGATAGTGPAVAADPIDQADPSVDTRPPRKSSGRLKRDASDIAVGKRKQARRDAR